MKNLLLIPLLTFAFSINASVINETTDPYLSETFVKVENGVSHVDTTTGLEWLDFGELIDGVRTNVTLGHSVNSAVEAYGSQGWELATQAQVIDLFNLFFAPEFNGGTTGTMALTEDPNDPLIMARNSWLFSFGTYIHDPEGDLYSRGFYLDEFDNIQEMGITLFTNTDSASGIDSTIYGPDYRKWTTGYDDTYLDYGVFMVRDYTVVPIPAAVWLFGSGLLGLVAVARRRS